MSKLVRVTAEQFDGVAVTVTLPNNIDEYAKSFLAIFNNVRESKELLHIENNFNNDVTVYCKPIDKDALIDFLKWYGEIKSCENVLMYQIEDTPPRDLDKYYNELVVPYID